MTTQVPMTARRFVVGVDGSEESRAALRWSADEAVARGARLEVVCAWDLPFSGLATSYSPAPAGLPDPREVARRAESALDQTLREVLADDAPLDIERVVEAGDPATVLLRR
ncbi:MAG TPA: universal stress protein, partial [Mycobacteriales bacterium]|nr:universal stress protein [Mycobacteriales bacterium]